MTKDTAPPKRRAARAALSPGRIAAAAFALIDTEGAAALSARRLAQALGCEAMSLYHHVPTMEAVLDLVVDDLLGRTVAVREGPARARLLAQARDFLALAERHPQVFVMATARRWKTPNAFALVEAAIAAFVAAGAPPRQAMTCARILGAYLGGAGAARAGWAIDAANTAADRPSPVPQAARRLPGGSNRAAVHRDLDHGIALLVDALLAGLPGGSGGPRA